jgi:hypothetical protein
MLIVTLLVGVTVVGASLVALVPLIDAVVDRQRAQHAADAAALAGVTGGQQASLELARRNGAMVVGWSREGHDVVVTVTLDGRRAVARATDAP